MQMRLESSRITSTNTSQSNAAVRQQACVTVTMGGGTELNAAEEEALLKTGAAC